MSKNLEDYVKHMGYMPNYKFPEAIDEDKEFVYYKFRVPRHYIREHIANGDTWPDYEESNEIGTRDESVVLGVGFFPVYKGVEYITADADFLYYKVRVPKVFLFTPVKGTPYTYGVLYDTKDFKLRTPEELAERATEIIPCEFKAGDSMPGRKELDAVRKVKETNILLYEVVFYCNVCGTEHKPEVGSDLFDLLKQRSCVVCGSTTLHLKVCKPVLEEEKDE